MTEAEALCKALDIIAGAPMVEPRVVKRDPRFDRFRALEDEILALRPDADEADDLLAAVKVALARRYGADEDVADCFAKLATALGLLREAE